MAHIRSAEPLPAAIAKAAPSRDADYGTLRSTRPTGAIARVKIEISAFAEAEVKDSLC